MNVHHRAGIRLAAVALLVGSIIGSERTEAQTSTPDRKGGSGNIDASAESRPKRGGSTRDARLHTNAATHP